MTTDFRVYCLTWNVAGTQPPKDLTNLLQLNAMVPPDLYVIGFQELDMGVQHVISNAMYKDTWTVAIMDVLGKNYFKVKDLRMMGLHIVVLVKRDKLLLITNVESEYTRRGSGGVGLKGAVTVRMDIAGIDSCFVNCHLSAHEENLKLRIEDFLGIVESQKFRDPDVNNILDHDYVFFMGDMNFRIAELSNEEVKKRIANADYDSLYNYDQLKRVRDEGLIFVDFDEAPIRFPPTFKFDPGTDKYDTSPKQRKPAWCDRILYMVHEDSYTNLTLDVTPIHYRNIPEYKQSDHRPVMGIYTIKILKNPPPLPVIFASQSTWTQAEDVVIHYEVSKNLPVASKDWIGLFKATFQHATDYVTWQWASTKDLTKLKDRGTYEIKLDHSYFENCIGNYRLGYFSESKNCLVGFSEEFKILLVKDLTSSSSSSSSDSSDDEGTSRKKKAL